MGKKPSAVLAGMSLGGDLLSRDHGSHLREDALLSLSEWFICMVYLNGLSEKKSIIGF